MSILSVLVVAGQSWTATHSDEVASREPNLPEAEFECWFSAASFRVAPRRRSCTSASRGSLLGACSRFSQNHSHPRGDRSLGPDDAEERATLEAALTRGNPSGQADCGHAGVQRTCAEARRSQSRQVPRGREAAALRGGVGSSRERFRRPERRRRSVQCVCHTLPIGIGRWRPTALPSCWAMVFPDRRTSCPTDQPSLCGMIANLHCLCLERNPLVSSGIGLEFRMNGGTTQVQRLARLVCVGAWRGSEYAIRT